MNGFTIFYWSHLVFEFDDLLVGELDGVLVGLLLWVLVMVAELVCQLVSWPSLRMIKIC
jgi:hypothetical protein